MSLLKRRPGLPGPVRAAVTEHGRPIAAAQSDDRYVVATPEALLVVGDDGEVALNRPWHEVDSGHWDPDAWTLTVRWSSGGAPVQWKLSGDVDRLAETVHERVQATVVLSESLVLPRRTGRVVLRRNLATRALFLQVALGRGTTLEDPEVRAEVERLSAGLRDEAGLD